MAIKKFLILILYFQTYVMNHCFNKIGATDKSLSTKLRSLARFVVCICNECVSETPQEKRMHFDGRRSLY